MNTPSAATQTLRVRINEVEHQLPAGSTLADAVQRLQPQGPYASAVNLQFVPKARYASTMLAEGDRIEIIAPVTGG
jgi:sulfur carrier protein